jgi:hypothetical protein
MWDRLGALVRSDESSIRDRRFLCDWSLGFDLVILVRTALSPAAHRNAY